MGSSYLVIDGSSGYLMKSRGMRMADLFVEEESLCWSEIDYQYI